MTRARTTLVSAQELAAAPGWRVFDCSHDLAAPETGAMLYAQAHIPGAVHAHLDDCLSGPKTGTNGRHPLPARATFVGWLGRQGLRSNDQVVAYDRSGGVYAARLWWLLRWVGHRGAAVLDGGFDAWAAQGLPLSIQRPWLDVTEYVAATPAVSVVDVEYVLRNLERQESVLLDARGANRFAGIGETMDHVGGHIPGARNRPYMDNLDARGRFKSPGQLRTEFDQVLDVPPDRVVAHCGSGVTACHNLLAMEVAGLPGARLYPGSWSEWCSDESRPMSTAFTA